MKSRSKSRKRIKKITAEQFDAMFDRGEDMTPYLDLEHPIVVRIKRVNVDFPDWMVKRLDMVAQRLNISRQAVIKMWIKDRLEPQHLMRK